jgi:hypothetical protein
MSNMLKEADEQKKSAVFGDTNWGSKQIVSFDDHRSRKSTTTPHRLKYKLVYEVNIEKMYQTNRETDFRREWCFHVACTTFAQCDMRRQHKKTKTRVGALEVAVGD